MEKMTHLSIDRREGLFIVRVSGEAANRELLDSAFGLARRIQFEECYYDPER